MAGTEAMAAAANEQLWLSAVFGRLEEVKKLLQNRADLESRTDDYWKRTPLHMAAMGGHRDIVQLLLEMNAKIETGDQDGKAPLHLAAMVGLIYIVQLLVEKNACLETTDSDGYAPLHVAVKGGHRDVVQLLLEKSAKIEATDQNGRAPLHLAVMNGHRNVDVVQLLVEKNACLETTDSDGYAPLHVAVKGGHRDIVQVLLEEKAEIEAKSSSGQTPLFLAAEQCQIEVAQLLLEKKAQIGTTDKDGKTTLSYAYGKVLDVLLEHIPKQRAWSWSLMRDVLSLDNQDQVVNFLDMWPQKAFMQRQIDYESLKSAPNFRNAYAQYWLHRSECWLLQTVAKKKSEMPLSLYKPGMCNLGTKTSGGPKRWQ